MTDHRRGGRDVVVVGRCGAAVLPFFSPRAVCAVGAHASSPLALPPTLFIYVWAQLLGVLAHHPLEREIAGGRERHEGTSC